MNALVQQGAGLPAHLQNRKSANVTAAAMGGIQVGKAHHRISINGKLWRLQDTQGNEFVVQAFHLDLIIVGANQHVSKAFYDMKYDPKAEGVAPACYSDNGIGPSSRAEKPQHHSCKICPMNVWGSKISELGSKTKMCGDSKKLAVILADNPTGAIYELRIPAVSMANVHAIAKDLESRGISLGDVVLRVSFDQQESFPKVVFEPTGYLSEMQMNAADQAASGKEVEEVIGADDVPAQAHGAVAAVEQTHYATAQHVPDTTPQYTQQVPMQQYQAAAVQQDPVFQQQAPVQPRAPQAPVFNPFGGPPVVGAPANFVQAPQTPVAEKPKRTRTAKPAVSVEPPTVSQAQANPFQFAAAQPVVQQPRQDVPNALPAAQSVPLAPSPTNAEMDALLAGALNV